MNNLRVSFAPHDVDGPTAGFLESVPGAPVAADDIIASYCQIIARTRGRGLRLYAATLTPCEGTDIFTPECERARQAVNDWIRTSGAFDAVLDFDAVWSDPAYPRLIKDGFHPADDTLRTLIVVDK